MRGSVALLVVCCWCALGASADDAGLLRYAAKETDMSRLLRVYDQPTETLARSGQNMSNFRNMLKDWWEKCSDDDAEMALWKALSALVKMITGSDIIVLLREPTAVRNLNLTRYQGLWYEIASSLSAKATFEFGCKCTTAEYELPFGPMPPLFLGITNRCERFGIPTEYNASAWFLSPVLETPGGLFLKDAKLQVQRTQPMRPGIQGNYWVLYIDPLYKLAVVGGFSAWLSPLFLLSRSRCISNRDYNRLILGALSAGIPLVKLLPPFLLPTNQEGCDSIDTSGQHLLDMHH